MKYVDFNKSKKFIFARHGDRAICIKLDYDNLFIPEDLDDQDYIEESEDDILYSFPKIYETSIIGYNDLILVQSETQENEISEFAQRGFEIYLPTGCDVWEQVNTSPGTIDLPRHLLSKLRDIHPLNPHYEGAVNTMTLMDSVASKESILVLPITPEAVREGIPYRYDYTREELRILDLCISDLDKDPEESYLEGLFETLELMSPESTTPETYDLLGIIDKYSELNQLDEIEEIDEKMLMIYALRKILISIIDFKTLPDTWGDEEYEHLDTWVDIFEDLGWAHYYFQWLSENFSEFYDYYGCELKDYWRNEYAGQ